MSGGEDPWARQLTRASGAWIARARAERKMSQEALCRRCAELGYPMKRPSLAALELGKRETLAVHEVIVIAEALGVPATELLFPPNTWIPYLPGERVTSFEAVERFTGAEVRETTPGQLLDKLLPERHVRALVAAFKDVAGRGEL